MFAAVMAASTQLMHLADARRSGLLATLIAGLAIGAALAWNMVLAWQVSRSTARLRAFMKDLKESN
jgi:tetrahydromethanopterin S-methyltransferase subunit F